MIDAKGIQSTVHSARHAGSEERAATTAGFMAGVPGMNIDSTSNSASVIGTVQSHCQQMRDCLNNLKDSINAQLAAQQEKQRSQRSSDFESNMTDMRPSHATGYPKEDAADFLKPFNVERLSPSTSPHVAMSNRNLPGWEKFVLS